MSTMTALKAQLNLKDYELQLFIDDLISTVDNNPNDQDLGKKVRANVNKLIDKHAESKKSLPPIETPGNGTGRCWDSHDNKDSI